MDSMDFPEPVHISAMTSDFLAKIASIVFS
jgi:hypothetical protein